MTDFNEEGAEKIKLHAALVKNIIVSRFRDAPKVDGIVSSEETWLAIQDVARICFLEGLMIGLNDKTKYLERIDVEINDTLNETNEALEKQKEKVTECEREEKEKNNKLN